VSDGEKVGINWMQVSGTALAAVSSTVLLSTLGVAGTLIGAAVGSVVASVGGALYSRALASSKQRVAVQASALRRAAQARTQGPQGTSRIDPVVEPVLDTHDPADVPTEEAPMADGAGDLPPEEASEPEPDALFHAEAGKPLPWKRIALVAGALFVVVLVALTAFELLTGKPVSSYTGGSSDTGTTLFQRSKETPSKSPTPTPTPSQAPTDGATEGATPTPSDSSSVLPSGTASPTETPTGVPTTGTPSATPGDGAGTAPATTP
jgi:hypothetical protein